MAQAAVCNKMSTKDSFSKEPDCCCEIMGMHSVSKAVQTRRNHREQRIPEGYYLKKPRGATVSNHTTAAASTCWRAWLICFTGIVIDSLPLDFCWAVLYFHEDCNNEFYSFSLFTSVTKAHSHLHTKQANMYGHTPTFHIL